jgi:hypothetical protein
MDRRLLIVGATLATAFSAPAMGQQHRTARSLAERFASTLTAHDLDGFAALLADDYVNHQTSVLTPPPQAKPISKQASRFLQRDSLACQT